MNILRATRLRQRFLRIFHSGPLLVPGAELEALGGKQFPGPFEPSLGLTGVPLGTVFLSSGSLVAPGITNTVPRANRLFSGIACNLVSPS